MRKELKKALVFLGLTFVCSWLLAGIFYLLGGRLNTPPAYLMLITYMFIPSIIAVVVQRAIYKEPLRELGLSFRWNRWLLAAWLIPPLLTLITLGISLFLPGVRYSPEMAGLLEKYQSLLTPEQLAELRRQIESMPVHAFWLSLVQGMIAGITVNAIAGFGEELGWRGFLQKELSYLGFWRASALIGVIWGLWHAPIIIQGYNFPQHPVAGVFMMIAVSTLLGLIFSYVRVKAGSVYAAAIIHGTFNGLGGLSLLVIAGGNDLTVGPLGLAGMVAMLLVVGALWLFGRAIPRPA